MLIVVFCMIIKLLELGNKKGFFKLVLIIFSWGGGGMVFLV